MALIYKTMGEVDCSVMYTTIPELAKETGSSKSTIHWHIQKDTIDGITVEGHKHNVFIDPENTYRYKSLIAAGIIRVKTP